MKTYPPIRHHTPLSREGTPSPVSENSDGLMSGIKQKNMLISDPASFEGDDQSTAGRSSKQEHERHVKPSLTLLPVASHQGLNMGMRKIIKLIRATR